MFDKKQVQEAIKRIDDTIAKVSGAGIDRAFHLTLANDVALVQKVCKDYFETREAAKTPEEKQDA